jgi:hypothetical protein
LSLACIYKTWYSVYLLRGIPSIPVCLYPAFTRLSVLILLHLRLWAAGQAERSIAQEPLNQAAFVDQHEAGLYEIRIKGHLDNRWAAWFDGLTITREDNGETLLTGQVVNQAALHRLLRNVRDLGLPLLSVMQVDPKPANGPL